MAGGILENSGAFSWKKTGNAVDGVRTLRVLRGAQAVGLNCIGKMKSGVVHDPA